MWLFKEQNRQAARKTLISATGILALGSVAGPPQQSFAQSGSGASFEVASIRQSTSFRNRPTDAVNLEVVRLAAQYNSQHGRFRLLGGPVSVLIQLAYNINAFQALGGPSWVNSDRYDVNAKAADDVTFNRMRPMLQALLTDRFKLTFQREKRELPVYEHVVAKGGIKIEAAKQGSCITLDPNNPPPAPAPNRPLAPLNICGGFRRLLGPLPDRQEHIMAVGISMSKLVEILANELGRTVLDKTGFRETFDLHLDFA